MIVVFATICLHQVFADVPTEDIQFLNELPIDNLIRLKNSLQELATGDENVTTTTPSYLEVFGAQAMAMKAPLKRSDWDEGIYKKDHHSKLNNIFSMSVTTLAFLAFGGYLLCLIVQAIKAKQMYTPTPAVTQPTTFVFSAGIKKRPQFNSYGRRKRDEKEARRLRQIDLPPEQLFSALLHLCGGYAKWSERNGDI